MACRVTIMAFHVHGQEADIDEFFENIEEAVTKVTGEAERRWPGLEFFEDGDELLGLPEEDE